MTKGRLTCLVIALCLVCASMVHAQSNAAPKSSVFDSLLDRDMFYGSDDYFGENADLIYADIVVPEEEDETPEPAVVTSSDDDDDDWAESDDDDGGSSGGDGSGVDVDPPDIDDTPDDLGGGDDCPT